MMRARKVPSIGGGGPPGGGPRSGCPFLTAHLIEFETRELEVDLGERRILVDVELAASLSLAAEQPSRHRLNGEYAVIERALGRQILQFEPRQRDLIDMQGDCRIVLAKSLGTQCRLREQQGRTAIRRS